MSSSINQKMAKGMAWMVAARLADRGVGLVSTVILARLLVPGDFGLVAMAVAIGGMLDLLGAFSFDVALIHKTKPERVHYDTAWTFTVMFGLICGVGMIALAHPAARFYHEPRLASVMYVMSVPIMLAAANNIGIVDFRKELNFHQEFVFIFTRRAVTFFITLGAAFAFRSYWALLIGITVGRMVNFVMSYKMNSYRPRFTFAASRDLFNFSKWLFINNFLNFLRHDGCTFIIGRMFGAAGLGIYSVSYELSNLPTTELVAPINRVAFPGYAKMQNRDAVRESYLMLRGLITLVIVPIGVGIAAVAEPLVLTVLGEKWIEGAHLIAIMAISGAIMSIQTNNTAVYLAMGRPQNNTFAQTIYLSLLFPGLFLYLRHFGIAGAGYAYLTAQMVDSFVQTSLSKRMLGFTWADIRHIMWRPLAGTTIMYLTVRMVDHQFAHLTAWERLAVDIPAGIVAYAAVILALWQVSARPEGAERIVLARAKFI
ncbi:MAG: lipopolysaccharide biosynthesis protein [Telluria sp.]